MQTRSRLLRLTQLIAGAVLGVGLAAGPALATLNSAFISQSVPAYIFTGQTASVTQTWQNTGNFGAEYYVNTYGTFAWMGTDIATPIMIGSADYGTTWGTNRYATVPTGTSYGSGQNWIATFNITAPAVVGTYTFQSGMLSNGYMVFGPNSPAVSVTVQAYPATAASATQGTSSTQISLAWTPSATTASTVQYAIYRCTTNNDATCSAGSSLIYTTAAGASSYVDSAGLTTGQHYLYHLNSLSNTIATGGPWIAGWTSAPPTAPIGVSVTQGTVTNAARVAWSNVAGAASYNVYRSGTKVNGSAISSTTYDDATAPTAASNFTVRAVSSLGIESADSASVSGYPNKAPMATSASLTATALAASVGVTPTVADPNVTAGQSETFTFAIVTQPSAGTGTASVVSNQLVYTPPAGGAYAGSPSFTFAVTDKGGASVNGTASVTVSAVTPGIPTSVAATDGTLTGTVRVTWAAAANAASYTIASAPTAGGSKTQITTGQTGTSYDYTVASVTPLFYSVQAVSASAATSSYSTENSGYPNAAPTATSASLSAMANAASTGVTPAVTDANSGDTFTFAIVSQPTTGQGSASIGANKLVWTPPAGYGFSGVTTFTYSATDAAGAAVTGTATVTVTGIPGVATGISATSGNSNGITVSWDAAASATYYQLYAAMWNDSGHSLVINNISTTSALYLSAWGAPYYFKIKACNPTGCSALSASALGQRAYAGTMLTPTATKGTYSNKVSVTWPVASGATWAAGGGSPFTYNVERQTQGTPATRSRLASSVGGTTYDDTSVAAGTTYDYFVQAMDNGSNLLAFSSSDAGYLMAVPAAPTGIGATTTTLSGIDVSWTPGAGGGTVAGFDVYRATSALAVGNAGWGTAIGANQAASPYSDTSAIAGITYFYEVCAVNAVGSACAVTASGGVLPDLTATGVSASDTLYAYVQVAYTLPGSVGARKVLRDGAVLAGCAAGPTGAQSYNDTSAVAGTTYSYAIQTYGLTDYACAGASVTSAADNGTKLVLPAATGVAATDGLYGDKVVVTWTPNAAAGYYKVHRGAAAQGACLPASTTSYDDTTAVPGTLYTYKVRVSADSLCSTAYQYIDSATDTGYAALGAPASVSATDGTATGKVTVTWNSVTSAASYKVYVAATAGGTKTEVGTGITGTSFDYTTLDVVVRYFSVAAVDADAGQGLFSTENSGYANQAPTATSASINAVADTATAGVTPGVTDPNLTAGQSDTFTFAVVSQPAAGEGTASVIANKLVWTPPAAFDFAGTTSFTYSATDAAGAAVTGTATVSVAGLTVGAPTGLSATQGTVTAAVHLSWTAAAGAASYNVYRAGTKVNGAPVTGTTFDEATELVALSTYTVRSVSPSAVESGDSTGASGYANGAPTAVSAVLTATATASSSGVSPTVSDPNLTAGQTELFTFAIVTQPSAGTGTASIVGNQLVYTPPAGGAYAGSPSFTFSVTDKGGASLTGTADVTVSAITPGIPTSVAATDGALTGTVRVTWTAAANATSYNIASAPTLGGSKTQIATGQTGTGYDFTVAAVTPLFYSVQAVSPSATSDYSTEDSGYPNAAPSATSATLSATATTASPAVTPSVTDANSGDSFTFAVVSQPAAGEGTASISTNKLVWTPPGANNFAGTTTFTYSATDVAGASVNGTATVSVAAVGAGVPTGVNATQGTATDKVTVTWSAVSGAASYNVYRDSTKFNGVAVTGTTYDDTTALTVGGSYTVRSVSVSAAESTDSSAASGYPNRAPTATTASLTATATTASAAVTPAVTDPNATAGQSETFTFAVITQPANGSASVVGNQLVYTPPAGGTYSGSPSFTFSVTDKGGASVNGTATVVVAAVAADVVSGVNATDGTLTGVVRVAWPVVGNAASYKVLVAATAGGTKTEIAAGITSTSYDYTVSNPATAYYSVATVSGSGAESAPSAEDSGYPNLAPSAASADLSATADSASALVIPSVTDANVGDTFTIALVSQPAAGEGTASVVANRLLWTPPAGNGFSGATSFTFSATDAAGANVTGTATVAVAPVLVNAPTQVAATQGTITDNVSITWLGAADAAGFNVYRNGTKLNLAAITPQAVGVTNTYNHSVIDAATASYVVRAVAASGIESPDSTASFGYPNVAPSAAAATLTATSAAASAPTTVSVTDGNVTAGQSETFTVALLTPPPAGEGTAAVSANRLVYTPPAGGAFAGTTAFTFSVTDKGGASVDGIATVTVSLAPPSAPLLISPSHGVYPSNIQVDWQINAAGGAPSAYDIYRAGSALVVGTNWGAPLAADVATPSFGDTTAIVGNNYWYKICAKNGGGVACGVSATAGFLYDPSLPAPLAFHATQGTITDLVRLTWNGVTGAVGYNVYAGATKVNADLLTGTTYDITTSVATAISYTVRSVTAGGNESTNGAAAFGWPNLAPTAASAALSTNSATTSSGTLPTVVDPNVTAGTAETYTLAIVSQPGTGEGTASVVNSRLVWTPPADFSFVGSTAFTFSVTDKGGMAVTGTATVTVSAAVAQPITISFRPTAGLAPPAGADYFLTYPGTLVAGTLAISSRTAGLTIKVTAPNATTTTSVVTGASYAVGIKTVDAVVSTIQTYTVEAFVTKVPTTRVTQTLSFGVIPRRPAIALLPPPLALTTAPMQFTVKIGTLAAGVYTYNPATHGYWNVTLNTISSTGALTPVEGATAALGSDGTVVLTAPAAAAGRVTFTATAVQTDSNTIPALSMLRSANSIVQVRNGAAIPVNISVKPVTGSGPSPLNGTVTLRVQTPSDLLDVGMVAYFVSDDGVNFTPLLDAAGTPVAGVRRLSILQKLIGNVKKYFKATVANKWDSAVFESPVASLESFVIPTVTLGVPKITILDHPITMTAVPKDASASLVYRWTVTLAPDAPVTATGSTFTFNPLKLGGIVILLEARETDALDIPAAWRKVSAKVAVLPPALPAPTVTGPSVVETSKSYTWSASQRSPFPANSGTDLVISSQWVLPDGTTATEIPVTYTMKEGDHAYIRYESWIEGYPNSIVRTDHALRPWTYVWPAWKLTTAIPSPYAPAPGQFTVGLVDPRLLASLHGEPLTYTWTFPQGVTVISQVDGVAKVRFETAGTYEIGAVVSDTRGYSASVVSPVLSILPPKPLTFNLTLTVGDRWNRPPGPVYAKTTTTSVPTGDRVAGTTFFVNNEQVGSEVQAGTATINLPAAGTYDIKAVMRTVANVTTEATQPVTLITGDDPVCTITKSGDGVRLLAFKGVCTVQRGVLGTYHWYINGAQTASSVTATTLSFSSADIARGISSVIFVATTDKGQRGAALFDMATGVSVPATPP